LARVFSCGLLCALGAAQARLPERQVTGNVIVSQHDPKVRIELPRGVQYVGADRWDLYDIADCELHAFVVADNSKAVRELYWIQFESYLPTKPDLHHTYDSPRHVEMGGLDFYVDTWARGDTDATRPSSDLEHIRRLLQEKGYRRPEGMMSVRLVHLL